jgi:hypothetical protein
MHQSTSIDKGIMIFCIKLKNHNFSYHNNTNKLKTTNLYSSLNLNDCDNFTCFCNPNGIDRLSKGYRKSYIIECWYIRFHTEIF